MNPLQKPEEGGPTQGKALKVPGFKETKRGVLQRGRVKLPKGVPPLRDLGKGRAEEREGQVHEGDIWENKDCGVSPVRSMGERNPQKNTKHNRSTHGKGCTLVT